MFNSTVKNSIGTSPNSIILGIHKNDETDVFEDYCGEYDTISHIPLPLYVYIYVYT